MKFEVDNISYLSPLKDYLFFLNKKISVFWEEIQSKDTQIVPVIEVIYYHKAYDIFIPLNMMVNLYASDDVIEWWNSIIDSIDCKHEIKDLTELLYSEFSNDNRRTLCAKMSDREYFQCSNSFAIVEKTVWKICKEYFRHINKSESSIYIGLYTGGLYSDFVSFDYLKYINEVVFKHLFKIAEINSKDFLASPYELALIKRTVFAYCSEFGAIYYNLVGTMVIPIISCDTLKLENEPHEYLLETLKDAIAKQGRTAFYLTECFVNNLEQLYLYSERYQFNSNSCKYLGACLPILMQCVSKNDQAVELSLNYINEMSLREKADERILLSLYIAMFTSDDNKQSHICNILDGIFNSEYQLNSMISVIKDIIIFFEKFSQELSMRFDIQKIATLKKLDPAFYCVYEVCVPELTKTGKTEFTPINDALVLSKHVFNCNVTNKMKQLLNVINDINTAYSEKLMAVADVNHLFYALASHLETEIRINITEVCRVIDFDNEELMALLSDKYEIFNIYNPKQVQELRALEQRLYDAHQKIPKYNTVLKYEHNLSHYFKRKLLERKKKRLVHKQKIFM